LLHCQVFVDHRDRELLPISTPWLPPAPVNEHSFTPAGDPDWGLEMGEVAGLGPAKVSKENLSSFL